MSKTSLVYIGLGSNDGDSLAHLRTAFGYLGTLIQVQQVSNLYVVTNTSDTTNTTCFYTVAAGTTDLRPLPLLQALQQIERTMGRSDTQGSGLQIIDLDILFYGMLQIDTLNLTIPHPRLPQRAWVLKPLVELAPNLMHPVLYYTMAELLQDCDDADQVQRYDEHTQRKQRI